MMRRSPRPVSDEERIEIRRLAAEKISARGISRQTGRHLATVQNVLADRCAGDAGWRKAIAAAARKIADGNSKRALLKPPRVTARPFTRAWYIQNQRSAAVEARAILAMVTRIESEFRVDEEQTSGLER